MSKLHCPLVTSKAAIKASISVAATAATGSRHAQSTQSKKQILFAIVFGLTVGFSASLSLNTSQLASLADKETELIAIQEIAEAILAETTAVTVADSKSSPGLATL